MLVSTTPQQPPTPSDPATLAIALTILGLVIAVLVVWRLLYRGRAATGATLSWIFLMLAAPFVGVMLFYVLGRRLHRRRLRRRETKLAWIEPTLDEAHIGGNCTSTRRTEAPTTRRQSAAMRLVDGIDEESVHHGQVRLLPDGPGFMTAAAQTIKNARHFIHLQTYILRPDHTGLRLLQLLTEAATRGVEVRVLYDSIGSWSLKARHLRSLVDAGGEAAAFMPLLWRRRPFSLNLRNHRKQLLVDGEIAYCGGRNIGDEYARDRYGEHARWLDTMVEVRGAKVTARLQRVFVEDWLTAVVDEQSESKLCDARYFLPFSNNHAGADEPGPYGTVGVVEGGPDCSPSPHHLVMFQLIASAEREVAISSPYLIPHPTILTALIAAASRGVRVRILTNGRRVEAHILFHAKRSFYPSLVDAGVQVLETEADYNHGKMVLVDESLLYIGSSNLDVRSEELNFELGVIVEGDAQVAREANAMFEERCGSATTIRARDLATGRVRVAVQNLCRLLSPLL